MAPPTCIDTTLDWMAIRAQAAAYVTTEYASLDRGGAPITWPVTPYAGSTGETIDVSTGLTYPLKAERARRNPKVALAFTHPTGSGLNAPATFVVQGLATVRDADLRDNAARYLVASSNRFPQLYATIPRAITSWPLAIPIATARGKAVRETDSEMISSAYSVSLWLPARYPRAK